MKAMKKSYSLILLLLLVIQVACQGKDPAVSSDTKVVSPAIQSSDQSAPVDDTIGKATRKITDYAGRLVEIPAQPERVICCGVGALRYTAYMQAVDLLVGVEDYEKESSLDRLYNYVNYDRLKDLPIIGGNGEPNIEQIVELNPQLIVMTGFVKMDPDLLQEKTGIPVVVIAGSDRTLDEKSFDSITLLGEIYGRQDRARELADYLTALREDLKSRTEDIAQDEKPTVYIGGVSFKGHHGFEGTEANYGPLSLIGADNLADRTGQEGAFNIDMEQVLDWDPDYIFLDFNGMDLIRGQFGEQPDFFNSLKAVREGRVFSQISFRSYASNLETALADAYYAGSILYPDRFNDIDPVEKAGEIYRELLGKDPGQALKEAGYEFRPIRLGE